MGRCRPSGASWTWVQIERAEFETGLGPGKSCGRGGRTCGGWRRSEGSTFATWRARRRVSSAAPHTGNEREHSSQNSTTDTAEGESLATRNENGTRRQHHVLWNCSSAPSKAQAVCVSSLEFYRKLSSPQLGPRKQAREGCRRLRARHLRPSQNLVSIASSTAPQNVQVVVERVANLDDL